MIDSPVNNKKTGYIAGASAYVIWGMLPVYWKSLSQVPGLEQLAWRIAGSALLAWLIILLRRQRLPSSAFQRKIVILGA